MSKKNFPRIAVAAMSVAILAYAAYFISDRSSPLKISASINRQEVLIGDSVRYKLEINADKGVALDRVDPQALFGDFTSAWVEHRGRFIRPHGHRQAYISPADKPGD